MARRLLTEAGQDASMVASLARSIRDWEKGKHYPRDWAAVYAQVFNLHEDVLFSKKRASHEDDEMERRRLLQALAALGVASPPVFDSLQTIRDSVGLSLGRDERLDVEMWEEAVSEHGYGYLLTPPQQMLGEVAADLVAVKQAMSRVGDGSRMFRSWCRVTGGLSLLMAKTLCNLEQSRQARQWWATASDAAELSGDPDLGLWIKAEQLIHGLYDQRPTPVLLRHADAALSRYGGSAYRGVAGISATRAQVLATVGMVAEATAELHRCGEVFERLPGSVTDNVQSIEGWGAERLGYTTAWVYAHLGDRDRLDHAVSQTQQILEHPDTRFRVQLALLQAMGHVRSGDVVEGVRYAQAVYQNHPAEQRTTMVTRLANEVFEAVPVAEQAIHAVADYRELVGASGRKAIT
ncbi:hypothetical protein ACFQ08_09140 [Streptosporangium algeriense]|uniref:XRE family transcriptional regulator n=1 Tax=Streptosporangium algeriense TaxID=1682748 RepID=A0ABW3DLP8_9ACTN